MKSVRIRSFSGPHFPAFGQNTERYSAYLRIQSKCGKIQTRKTPNPNTFHTVLSCQLFSKKVGLKNFTKFIEKHFLRVSFTVKLQAVSNFFQVVFCRTSLGDSLFIPYFNSYCIVQKMKLSIKNFFSKCDQIHRKLGNFIFLCRVEVNLSLYYFGR